MQRKKFQHIYGPVSSWRLGVSLGVDLLPPGKKTCTFDCLYCQLGPGGKACRQRRVFVPLQRVLNELESLPAAKIDYLTFSGSGEPALAANLAAAIRAVKRKRKEDVAVITNGSLLDREKVRRALLAADLVLVKLDAHSEELFLRINRPRRRLKLSTLVKGIKKFAAAFKGRLALQVMFIRENAPYAKEIARLAGRLSVKEIQINTPLRPSAAKALSKKELRKIKGYFIRECGRGVEVTSVYDRLKKRVIPLNRFDTAKRRGGP